ncbi:MAG: rhodanese-like domain-containing protein [Spirochaetes bacterium]|nr:rhodanese-like domain-containing protein [Spirochaetota bacterium]
MNKKTGILFIFFLLIITYYVFPEINKKQIIKKISSKTAYTIINKNKDNKDMIILDVRTPGEFNGGYIEGAQNINFNSENFEKELDKLDKNKKYLVYCRSGNRSGKAVLMMKKLGFMEVYDFGGIINWVKEGYTIVK